MTTTLETLGFPRLPAGSDIVQQVRALPYALGFDAPTHFAARRGETFAANRDFSNLWITDQVAFYDASIDPSYRAALQELMDGGGEEGHLGMRNWLNDPDNLAFWDNAIVNNVGELGYARLISLNAAFGIGHDDFRLTYGGIRRYDAGTNVLTLNGTPFPGATATPFAFSAPTLTPEQKFELEHSAASEGIAEC